MHSFLKGLWAAIPIASGYIPVAITFGLVVKSVGLTTLDATLASLFMFAGAAQFLAIGMYGAAGLIGGGISPASLLLIAQIVVAGWLLNVRHLLMSSVIAHNLGSEHYARAASGATGGAPGILARSVLAFGVTDEVFGVAGWRIAEGGTVRPPYLLGLEVGAYSAWVGGTVVGALTGEILPEHLRVAMGLALYALFAALLAGQFRAAHGKEGARVAPLVVAASSAALINAALRMGLGWDAGAAFPVAMVAGAVIAMAVGTGEGTGERTDPGERDGSPESPGPGRDRCIGSPQSPGPGRTAGREDDARGSY